MVDKWDGPERYGGMAPGISLARVVVLVFALAALVAPPRAEAQNKVHRLGVISVSVASIEATATRALLLLAKEGFVEGRNLTMIGRHGTAEQLPGLMREILAAKPDVILAIGGDAIRLASRATETVPIVAYGPDLISLGVAESIARPGRNVTGVVILPAELDGKRLALLHEALPRVRRLAALVHPSSPNRQASEREIRAAAAGAGLDLRLFYAAGPQDYAAAFAAMHAADVHGAAILANPEYFRDRALITRHALAVRLPTICQWEEMAAEGCMLSYGPSLEEMRARLVYLIVRIFNGAKPSELPIEQPTKVEFVVNLKTAKALGISLPQSLLVRAEQVIE
jgi:putative tryptophan/tyrosine transport system substrate-binding protein